MPWCPNCREEYRDGFKTCIDCGAELVDELPPPAKDDAAAELGGSYGRQGAGGKGAGEYGRTRRGRRRVAPSGDGLCCPRCGTEYRRGFALCGDCGAELVAGPVEIAEEDEAGEEDEVKSFCDARLVTVAGWPEAGLLEERLNEDGIPAVKVAGAAGVDIYVPEELLDSARDVVDSVRELAGDNGRTGADAGGPPEPAPPAAGGSGRLWCPKCRVEYWQEGAAVCRDCGTKLVDPAAGS